MPALRAGLRLPPRVTLRGRSALLALLALFAVPHLLARRPSPEDADRLIRDYLRWQVTIGQRQQLEAAGLTLPDSAMAVAWLRSFQEIDSLVTAGAVVRRSVIAPPLRRRFAYVVRWTVGAPGAAPRVEYFRIRGGTMYDVRPSSPAAFRFRV